MTLAPGRLGLVFSVLPVLVLFFVGCGTIDRWAAQRAGPTESGLAPGLIPAWAVAASTLFQTPA